MKLDHTTLSDAMLARLVAAKLHPDGGYGKYCFCLVCGKLVEERTWACDKCYADNREWCNKHPRQPHFNLTDEELASLEARSHDV